MKTFLPENVKSYISSYVGPKSNQLLLPHNGNGGATKNYVENGGFRSARIDILSSKNGTYESAGGGFWSDRRMSFVFHTTHPFRPWKQMNHRFFCLSRTDWEARKYRHILRIPTKFLGPYRVEFFTSVCQCSVFNFASNFETGDTRKFGWGAYN